MPRKKLLFLSLLTLSILSPACGKPSTSPSAIIGGVWKIRSIETFSGGVVGVTNTAGYTVSFGDGGKLAARADCNLCNGTYSVSGDQLQISPLACTKAVCAPNSYDALFVDILTSATTFGVQGIELTIESPKGTLRMNQ